jgi:hypothetical protein
MTTTIVKTYRKAKDFEKDAVRMARRGYQVVATFQEPSKNKPLRNLLKVPVGGTWVWGSSMKGGKIVVTYQAFGATVVAQPTAGLLQPPSAPATIMPRGREPLRIGNLLGGLMILAIIAAVLIILAHGL